MTLSPFLRTLIRANFRLTTRASANRTITSEVARYEMITDSLTEEELHQAVRVPSMRGVDEDMREWSITQILEHNIIVNGILTDVQKELAGGIPMTRTIDPKRDVMPSNNPSPDIFEKFIASTDAYESTVAEFLKLRGTKTRRHPVLGELDAHGWHCMFGRHLAIHRKQAAAVAKSLRATKS